MPGLQGGNQMFEERTSWLRNGYGLHSVCQRHDRYQNCQRMGQVQMRDHAIEVLLAALLFSASGLSRADAPPTAGEKDPSTKSTKDEDESSRSFKRRAWEEYVRRG